MGPNAMVTLLKYWNYLDQFLLSLNLFQQDFLDVEQMALSGRAMSDAVLL
jgi:hypothetical protein|tara:strand:- start:16602 stop:16751 length:150 start_codon:yes stop_codon:yes gene_type:complete